MRLICPNCATQYEVPDSAIPAQGRKVECGNCGNGWHVSPPEAEAAPAPQVTEPEPVLADAPPAPAEEAPVEESPVEEAEVVAETDGQPAFDANVLRELLARPVTKGDATEEAVEAPTDAAPDEVDAPSFEPANALSDGEETAPGDIPADGTDDEVFAQQDDVAGEDHEAAGPVEDEAPAAEFEEYAEEARSEPEGEDTVDGMSIPPVPQPDNSVRQSADAAFEAMRARRAARRAARAAQREQEQAAASAEVAPEQEAPAADADNAETDPNVMADLRRLIDSDDAQGEASDDTVEELPEAPRRPRRERPQRPGTETPTAAEGTDDDRVVPLSRRPRPKRPGASEAIALPEQEQDTAETEISAASMAADDVPARGRGVLGFAVAIMLFVVLAVVYMIAPSLSAAVPTAAPVLEAYASGVDALRLSISDTYRGLTGGGAPTSG